jgi:hypothetical protein
MPAKKLASSVADEPHLWKVDAAEPERASIRGSVEICLAPPEMTEQHACPGASSHFDVQVRCHQQRLEHQ